MELETESRAGFFFKNPQQDLSSNKTLTVSEEGISSIATAGVNPRCQTPVIQGQYTAVSLL